MKWISSVIKFTVVAGWDGDRISFLTESDEVFLPWFGVAGVNGEEHDGLSSISAGGFLGLDKVSIEDMSGKPSSNVGDQIDCTSSISDYQEII